MLTVAASVVASSPSSTLLVPDAAVSAVVCHSCLVPVAFVLGIAERNGVSDGEISIVIARLFILASIYFYIAQTISSLSGAGLVEEITAVG